MNILGDKNDFDKKVSANIDKVFKRARKSENNLINCAQNVLLRSKRKLSRSFKCKVDEIFFFDSIYSAFDLIFDAFKLRYNTVATLKTENEVLVNLLRQKQIKIYLSPTEKFGDVDYSGFKYFSDYYNSVIWVDSSLESNGTLRNVEKLSCMCHTFLTDISPVLGVINPRFKELKHFVFSGKKFGLNIAGAVIKNKEISDFIIKHNTFDNSDINNAAAISGFTQGLVMSVQNADKQFSKFSKLKNRALALLNGNFNTINLNSDTDNSLPSVLNFSVNGLELLAETIADNLTSFSDGIKIECIKNNPYFYNQLVNCGIDSLIAAGSIRIEFLREADVKELESFVIMFQKNVSAAKKLFSLM